MTGDRLIPSRASVSEKPSQEAPASTRPPSLGELFLSFLRLGLTAFGGPAMVAFIRKMAVQDKHWLEEDRFRTGVALCQTIPGATAMQTTAYTGLQIHGVAGAAASFVGFGLPAFALMFGLSALYAPFHSLPAVSSAFGGLRALIVALIAHASVVFGRSYLKRWRDLLIVAFAAVLFWFGLSPIFAVVGAALLGIALSLRKTDTSSPPNMARFPLHWLPLSIVLGSAGLGVLLLFILDKGLFQLSLLMMKVDLFAFGGGFASIPLMLHEVVDVRHWMSQQAFMDGIALGQITPGPVVITSTFVGYMLRGPLGAAIATVSIFLPSFVMVIVTSPFFLRLNAMPLFRKGVSGILCSFVGLLVSTAVRLGFAVPWTIPYAAMSVAAFTALLLGVDLLWVILAGAGLSFLSSVLGL